MFRSPTNDLIVILVIVLLIFGPKRLPSLGRQLGSGLREFKDSITGDSDDEKVEQAQLPQTNAAEAPPANLSSQRDSAEVGTPERRP
jgi:sec-independent protein translocase protein TatA